MEVVDLLRTTLATQAKDADEPGLPSGFTDCTDTNHLTRVTAYALTEAGMTAGETTSVSLDDIACIDGVLYVSALGNNNLFSRVIELDHFEAGAVLALHQLRTLDPEWHATQPLTYQQNTTGDPKKSSAVCAYNRLNRIMVAAGLRHSDTTAASICTWRYQLTFDTQGLNAAVQQSGYPKQHLLTRIVLSVATDSEKAERTNALWGAFDPIAA